MQNVDESLRQRFFLGNLRGVIDNYSIQLIFPAPYWQATHRPFYCSYR